MLAMKDIGSGSFINFTIPQETKVLKIWLDGAGGGGGGGGPNGGGGGGGSGAKCYWVFKGDPLGGMTLQILTGTSGTGGAGSLSGGIPGSDGQHTTVKFPNGFTIGAGGAQGGSGQPSVHSKGGDPQCGGCGGNAFSSEQNPGMNPLGPDIKLGQFNLGCSHGQDGGKQYGGRGGCEGDTSGGGRGGNLGMNGENGQGGYVHIECY